ncbi:hypothetical protein P7C70_g7984, partial [Phenoliferia sp. Uapishka_3]
MAAHQNVRQLTLQERFELHAPYIPTITLPTLYKPDYSQYDLIASSSTGNFYLRTMPHSFEKAPRWSPDILCPVQILRSICEFSAKLVAIPPGHPALKQYEDGLITHMIEGGTKMDVHGRGESRINLYGFAESKWNHPRITADFANTELQGYISESLLEMSVDGVGRLRALGLARLQEVARWPGGLGITMGESAAETASPRAPASTSNPLVAHSTSPSTPNNSLSTVSTYPSPQAPLPAAQPPSASSQPPLPTDQLPPANETSPSASTAQPTSPPLSTQLSEKSSGPPTATGTNGATTPVSPNGTGLATQSTALPTSTDPTSAKPTTPSKLAPQPAVASPQNITNGEQTSARAQALARAKQVAAHITMRHSSSPTASQTQPTSNGAQERSSTGASSKNSGQSASKANSNSTSGSAASGSRKRKSTSPRNNLRADTDDLFNKSQKLRQTHDWRTENGPGGRTANDWRGHSTQNSIQSPTTSSRLPPRPAQHVNERLARTPHQANLPLRPSADTSYRQHHPNSDSRGDHRGTEARPSRFDHDGMGFVERALNYGQPDRPVQLARPTQPRPTNVAPTDPRLMWRPIDATQPLVSGEGRTDGTRAQHTAESSPALAAPLPPFDRVISPPPHSNYSTRGHSTRSQASDFFLPPPRNYTTSQLTRDPHRQLPPNYRDLFPRATYGYDETADFAPVTHPMEVGHPVELVAGGLELVDEQGAAVRNSDVVAKLEEGQVIDSDLSGGEWQVVGEGKKTSKWVDAQAQTTPTPVAGPSRLPAPSRPPTQSRLPPRRPAIGKSKLSTVYNADEDSGTDMETGSSGEIFHHRSQAFELTKICRQNELDVEERKTRAQRRFRASQKRHWQEKLSRWEEHKKMNGGGNTKDARRRFWAEESEL